MLKAATVSPLRGETMSRGATGVTGSVASVADDDLMGTTVVIAHDGGYETTYSNLQSVPTVAPEQYVSAGQVIGAVGTTSLAEASMSPHLHFSVTKDGEIIDPQKFLKS